MFNTYYIPVRAEVRGYMRVIARDEMQAMTALESSAPLLDPYDISFAETVRVEPVGAPVREVPA